MLQDLEKKLGINMSGDYLGVEEKLENLANMRRDFVAWSLKSIIRRRIIGSEQDVISLPNCRLLGMYWSTQYPETYISQVNIDSTSRTCTLETCDCIEKKIRKIDATWSVLSSNDRVHKLEVYLQRGRPQAQPTS
ncbi:uncharacterized protein LOC126845196 [Adelges cooleyi]|uniref:uncharacterized protein LOC126845196 n=1 Tax=Adelges cooleyi TaxID=133065 RepID=UPI00217F8670|nr:uncharacterized protein LOC126845196 [Adelges cooleyi]